MAYIYGCPRKYFKVGNSYGLILNFFSTAYRTNMKNPQLQNNYICIHINDSILYIEMCKDHQMIRYKNVLNSTLKFFLGHPVLH